MSKRLAVLCLLALPLAGIACSGPSGLRAEGALSVDGTTSGGPFDGTFSFPESTRLDGSAGLTAMCTVSRAASGANGAVVDLIVPTGASNPLEGVSFMVRNGETTGTIEADVRGEHFASSSCGFWFVIVNGDGTVHLQTDGDCALSSETGTDTVDARIDLVLQGCTVIDG